MFVTLQNVFGSAKEATIIKQAAGKNRHVDSNETYSRNLTIQNDIQLRKVDVSELNLQPKMIRDVYLAAKWESKKCADEEY